jgi:hypothetical protein
MKTKFLSLLAASFLFAACGKDEHVHTPGDGHGKEAGHVDDHGGGGHGAMVSLGSIQLGGVAVDVELEGALEPGNELGVEISFAKDKPLVGTVRAWVGVESANGSMKGKLVKEGDTALHGHLEVPKSLPEGSKIWFEVDGASAGKASIGFHK